MTPCIQGANIFLAPKGLEDKLDAILTYLKDHTVNKQEFAEAMNAVSLALEGVGEQLTKATAEIIEAAENAGISSPEMNAALAKLQLVAASLEGASQGLDDLNPDAVV